MLQKILYNLEIALDAITQNRLRAFLTSLGIIFGVASVIAMLAIGSGAEQEILAQMELLGTNNVVIRPVVEQEEGLVAEDNEQANRFSPGLSLLDLQAISEVIPEVKKVSPEVIYDVLVIRKGLKRTGKFVGVDNDYFDISNLDVVSGQRFSQIQMEEALPVCIIGDGVRAKFFAGEDPIGKQIKCGQTWLTVIGVLKRLDSTVGDLQRLGIRDFNMDIFSPIQTVLLRHENRALVTTRDVQEAASNDNDDDEEGSASRIPVNYHQLDKIVVQVDDNTYMQSIADILARFLQRRHNDVIDFEVIVPELLLQQEQRTKRIFNIVLSSIASISLIVGGIGIMNIMLASVIERYKEIGVRMAIGARKHDIMLQFLTEALAISLTGGIIGIVLGVGLSYVIEESTEILTIVTPLSIFISFGVALMIGVIFGLIPARRAAEYQPADAVRYE